MKTLKRYALFGVLLALGACATSPDGGSPDGGGDKKTRRHHQARSGQPNH